MDTLPFLVVNVVTQLIQFPSAAVILFLPSMCHPPTVCVYPIAENEALLHYIYSLQLTVRPIPVRTSND